MALFRDAALGHGCQVSPISYDELLTGRACQAPMAAGTIVRIDSPGPNAAVTRCILTAGIEPMEQRGRVPLGARAIDARSFGRGEIVRPLQWFLGLRRLLRRLEALWTPRGAWWMNTPSAVLTAFDKRECRDLWSLAALPIAAGMQPIQSYAKLRAAAPDRHRRLFIKLRYGYSAMGAVALEWRGDRARAITTVEVTRQAGEPRLFVSKRPRVLDREQEIAWLVDTLALEEIVVEDWLPKARLHGKPFDLRILTIGGRARHVVGRAHNSPFTNLNLDADRVASHELAELLGEHWPGILSLAERAAARIPGAWSLGMDLLVRPGRRDGVLLEANAFGDYLPGLLCDGETTYEMQIREFLRHRVAGESGSSIAAAKSSRIRGVDMEYPAGNMAR